MQTCGLRAVSRGKTLPADSDPDLAHPARLDRALLRLHGPALRPAAGRTCASWGLRSSWRAAVAGVRGVLMASARNTHRNHSISRLALCAQAGLILSGPGFLPRPLWRLDPGGRNGEARADHRVFRWPKGPSKGRQAASRPMLFCESRVPSAPGLRHKPRPQCRT